MHRALCTMHSPRCYAPKPIFMKKLNFFLMAAAGLALASCSQDELNPSFSNGGGNVHFTVSLPSNSVSSRAIGDGFAATNLSVLVYDVDDTSGNPEYSFVMDGNQTFPDNNLSTTVDLDLVTGKSYKIVFFAYSPAAMPENETDPVYSIDTDSGTLKVNYAKMNSDDNLADDYGCFYGTYTTEGPVGNNAGINANVTLTRPVAQINWGTTGFGSESISNVSTVFGENGEYIVTSLAVSAYTTLDMLNDTYGGQENVDLLDFATPNTLSTVPAFPGNNGTNTYNYMAMQYVLAPSETSATYDLVLTVKNNGEGNESGDYSNEITVSNAPVQANYQTNIYGSLLSSHATFTVTKSAAWGENSPYNVSIWDGATTSEPAYDEDTNTYTINTPGEWIWLTKNYSTTDDRTGSINADINLNSDLDFAGFDVQGVYFSGTFNGNGHTLKNLTITPKSSYSTGFIGNDIAAGGSDIVVENLTFDNVTITNHVPDYGWVGVVVGDVQNNNVVLNNVTVTNANLSGVNSVGGLIGFVASEKSVTINGCSVTDSNISNIPVANESGNVCGMVGRVVGTCTFGEGNSVSDVTINGYWCTKRTEASINEVAYNNRGSGTINGQTGVKTSDNTVNKYELAAVVSSTEDLASAIDNAPNGSTIVVTAGTVQLPGTLSNKELTFKGQGIDETVIDAKNAYWSYENCNINFEDMTLDSFVNAYNHTSMGFQNATSQTYTNVKFFGEFHVFTGDATFNDCQFVYDAASQTNYQLWCQTSGTVNINNCSMTCNDAKAILVYGWPGSGSNPPLNTVGGDININGLTVTNNTSNDKAVVEIHSELYTEAGTININNVTYPNTFQKGLWQEIYNVDPYKGQKTNYYKIVVNGKTEQDGGFKGTFTGSGN